MSVVVSIIDYLDHGRESDGRAAILAPGRVPLSYGRLREHVLRTVEYLNSLGYGRNDRIAVALPSGPEMAVALLCIMAGFACVPLDPGLRQPEFEKRLADFRIRALICRPGDAPAAVGAARSLGVAIIELSPLAGEDGLFTLYGQAQPVKSPGGMSEAGDETLILQTSGTTSRPKIVPSTCATVCYDAELVRGAVGLTADDRCLVIAPLYLGLAMISALLPMMAAGGSVVCTGGMSEQGFPQWLSDFRPTWYTGTPAIHLKALDSVRKSGIQVPKTLRLIRSSSSSMPVPLLNELEETFGTVLLESYGMTEAGLIACNPLPPRPHKPGSVGMPVGCEVMIADDTGRRLPAGEAGEILVRGPAVMKGYENAPELNEKVFHGGWLRTGDLGRFDADGYLYIVGRVKELINRGGEKISPYEVEEVLHSHPAVGEVAAFSVPDPSLGEAVAAAVALKDGTAVTRDELRSFAAQKLSFTKVPSLIVFVDAIPRSPSGKIQRIGMADMLRITPVPPGSREYVPPATDTQVELLKLWSEVLGREHIGIDDDFFDLGGRSIDAGRLFGLIESRFGLKLTINTIFEAPTVRRLAEKIDKGPTGTQSILLLRDGTVEPPLFCINSVTGTLSEYKWMYDEFKDDRWVYGLQTPWNDPDFSPSGYEDLAAYFVRQIKSVRPRGPYYLIGYCAAGIIAYEMAQQLGGEVRFLGMTDVWAPKNKYRLDLKSARLFAGSITRAASNILYAPPALRHKRLAGIPSAISEFVQALAGKGSGPWNGSEPKWVSELPELYQPATRANVGLHRNYTIKPYKGDVGVFISEDSRDRSIGTVFYSPTAGWERFVDGRVETYFIPGDHASLVKLPNAKVLARAVEECLKKADDRGEGP